MRHVPGSVDGKPWGESVEGGSSLLLVEAWSFHLGWMPKEESALALWLLGGASMSFVWAWEVEVDVGVRIEVEGQEGLMQVLETDGEMAGTWR